MIDWSKYKSVPKGAGKKIMESFNKNRRKEPSDELVKIISEVQPDPISEQEKEEQRKRDDKVARSPEA